MNNKLSYLLFYCFLIFISLNIKAQEYANKRYYLIDSLDLNSLSNPEKKLIDSSLQVFHTTKIDTVKAKTINSLVAYLADERVWPKYNNWLTKFTSEKLEHNQLSQKEKKLLINIQALTFNNQGYLLRGKSRYKEALVVYKKSLKVLKEIDDKEGQGNVLNNLGAVYKNLGDIPSALESHQKSLALKIETENKKGEAYTLNNIANIYKNLGDIKKALEYYLLSLTILEELNDKKGVAIVLNNVATVYLNQGDKAKAKEYFEKSLEINKEINNKRSFAITLNHLADIYSENKDKSVALLTESLEINKELGDKSGEANTLRSLGGFYIKNNQPTKGFALLKESLAIFKSIDEVSGQINCLNAISKYCLSQNKIPEAKKHVLESLELAKKIGFPSSIKNSANILSIIYEKEENWKEAFNMQKLFAKMQDSIRNENLQKDIIKQQTKFDIDKKEQEIEILSAQNKALEKDKELQQFKLSRNRIIIASITSALLLLLLLFFVIIKSNKRRKQTYKLLKKQKEEISIKNDEKATMLKEIHHRVKNNLQTINSLLRLQSKDIDDKEVKQKFSETQKRVISIASLHERMYQSDNLHKINAREHINQLLKDLVSTYSINQKINLDIEVPPIFMGTKTLIPLGLIINEVIINSLKYAFVDREEGTIILKLKMLECGKFEMIIGDNGIGGEENSKTGMGGKLIKIFTKQLNGKIEKIPTEGWQYKIRFECIDNLKF